MSDGEMLYDLALTTAHEAIDDVRRAWPKRPLPALFHARLDLATTGSWVGRERGVTTSPRRPREYPHRAVLFRAPPPR